MIYGRVGANARPIPGMHLAHCSRRPLVARDFDGLDLWRGTTQLVAPLLSQSAQVCNTTPYRIRLADIVDGEPDLRAAVWSGDLTLAQAAGLARESAMWKDLPPVEQPAPPVTRPVVIDNDSPTPELVAPSNVEVALATATNDELIAAAAALRAALEQVYATF